MHLLFGKQDIKLPEGKAKKLESSEYVGREVVMGIRPENIRDEEIYLESMSENVVEGRVEVVEMLGSETLIYMVKLQAEGKSSRQGILETSGKI